MQRRSTKRAPRPNTPWLLNVRAHMSTTTMTAPSRSGPEARKHVRQRQGDRTRGSDRQRASGPLETARRKREDRYVRGANAVQQLAGGLLVLGDVGARTIRGCPSGRAAWRGPVSSAARVRATANATSAAVMAAHCHSGGVPASSASSPTTMTRGPPPDLPLVYLVLRRARSCAFS